MIVYRVVDSAVGGSVAAAAAKAVAASWTELLPMISSVAAAIIGGCFVIWNGHRQRRHEERQNEKRLAEAEVSMQRDRLAPDLRTLIQIDEELRGVAVRLADDPAHEVHAALAPLRAIRDKLNGVVQPELLNLREDFHTVTTAVVQWRAVAKGLVENGDRDRPVHVLQAQRVDRYQDEVLGQVQTLTNRARAMFRELARP